MHRPGDDVRPPSRATTRLRLASGTLRPARRFRQASPGRHRGASSRGRAPQRVAPVPRGRSPCGRRRAGGGGKAEAPPARRSARSRPGRRGGSTVSAAPRPGPITARIRRTGGFAGKMDKLRASCGGPPPPPGPACRARPRPQQQALPSTSREPGSGPARGLQRPPRGHRRRFKSEYLTNSAGSCRIRPPPQRGRDTTAVRSPLRGRREQGRIALEG